MVLPLELPLQGRLIWLAGGEGRGGGRGAQGLPATRLHCLPLCCVPRRVAQVARVAGPLPQACLVVLRPLVEEKVKEQLEAAKPEPVIEEVVSGGAGPPRGSRGPSPRPALRSPLALHFVPFPPPSFLSLPFSCLCPPPSCVPWDWVPPALTCICPLHRTWPTLHPGSLTGECRPWRTSADGAGALGAGLGPRAGPFHPCSGATVGPDLWLHGTVTVRRTRRGGRAWRTSGECRG